MQQVYASTVIEAAPEKLWAILRDFGAIQRFIQEIESCELENGARLDQVGATRRVVLKNGAKAREQLQALSDLERTLVYSLFPTDSFPIVDYVARVRVAPVTDSGKSFVEWSSTFSVTDNSAKQTSEWCYNLYLSAFDGLRALSRR